MKEQQYIIKMGDSFELEHIFECGQCFRWNKQDDGSYTGVVGQAVINVKQENDNIIFIGILNGDIKEVCEEYFDLGTNYTEIKDKLSKIDEHLKTSIAYGKGIRILKQDLWETLISFIISANNNIPRIKGIIEKMSKKYGEKITWNGVDYYTFPTAERLAIANVEDLRALGLGFRDKRVWETTQMVVNKQIDLEALKQEQNVDKLRDELLKFSGVGDKVADCIMLFSLQKLEVFPIDVWVRRVMNELYIKEQDETKVNKKQIQELASKKYANLAGIAQQYLFYWKRSA